MANKGLIIGDGNILPGEDSRISAFNCDDQDFTGEANGVYFSDKKASINDDGDFTTTGTVAAAGFTGPITPSRELKEIDFDTSASVREYFIDASGGNVTVTIVEGDENEHVFWRIDGTGNTVTIAPATLNINGGASVSLNTQYQRLVTSYVNSAYYAG